jgi:hypothetical protein
MHFTVAALSAPNQDLYLAATFVADIGDTAMKRTEYVQAFGAEYPIRIAVNLAI